MGLMSATRLGLYIHWPFCLAKCPYCDFNSHVVTEIDSAAWQKAMLHELRTQAEQYHTQKGLTQRAHLQTIFFGGGTPSLMPAEIIESLISSARELFHCDETLEITAEANPTSVETAKIIDFAQAGVNRLSLGIQSLTPQGLQYLGREHSPEEALYALETALKYVKNVSGDLIYGLPGQTADNWQKQLERILNYGLSHLSAYQLTIEPGTVFYTRARAGEIMTAEDDHVADLYLLTEQLCQSYQLQAYEVSNYAVPDAQSRHNCGYWNSGDWLAIGPGAHGQYWAGHKRFHFQNRRSPKGWLDAVSTHQHGQEEHGEITAEHAFEIYWMMGLRLTQGMPIRPQYPALQNFSLNPEWVDFFSETGWLENTEGRLRTSLEGRLKLNSILEKILDI